MATEIKMNPEELRGQAARLANISNRMQDITNKTQGAMSAMVGAVSPSLVMNLDWKGKMLLTGLDALTKSLQWGEKTAINAANELESADSNIGKESSEIIGRIRNATNVVKDTVGRIKDEKKEEFRQQRRIEELDSIVASGKTVTSIFDEYGNFKPPYDNVYKWEQADWFKYDSMQCVTYARCRFAELTGTLPIIGGNAVDFQYTYKGDDRFEYVTDIANAKVPCIAVTAGASQYGHVVIIEDIVRNDNGSTYVYFSQANVPNQADGTLSKCELSQFYSGYTNPMGFVQLK